MGRCSILMGGHTRGLGLMEYRRIGSILKLKKCLIQSQESNTLVRKMHSDSRNNFSESRKLDIKRQESRKQCRLNYKNLLRIGIKCRMIMRKQ